MGDRYVDPIYLILKGASPLPSTSSSNSGGSNGPASCASPPAPGGLPHMTPSISNNTPTSPPFFNPTSTAVSRSSQGNGKSQAPPVSISPPVTGPSTVPAAVPFGATQSTSNAQSPPVAQPPVWLPVRSSSNDAPAPSACCQRSSGAAGGVSGGASAASLSPNDLPPRRPWGSQEGVLQSPGNCLLD